MLDGGPARSATSNWSMASGDPFGDDFHGPVRPIGDPAVHAQPARGSLHEPAEPDTLDRASDDGVQSFAGGVGRHRASLRLTPAMVRGQRRSRSSRMSRAGIGIDRGTQPVEPVQEADQLRAVQPRGRGVELFQEVDPDARARATRHDRNRRPTSRHVANTRRTARRRSAGCGRRAGARAVTRAAAGAAVRGRTAGTGTSSSSITSSGSCSPLSAASRAPPSAMSDAADPSRVRRSAVSSRRKPQGEAVADKQRLRGPREGDRHTRQASGGGGDARGTRWVGETSID